MGEKPKIDIEDAVLEVQSVGDSLGVILPKALVERLNLKSGDRLSAVAQPDGSVAFTPVDEAHVRIRTAANTVLSQYAETFRILAK